MKLQAYIDDPLLEAKIKQLKEETEEEVGIELSWSLFTKKMIRGYVNQKDDNHVHNTRPSANG